MRGLAVAAVLTAALAGGAWAASQQRDAATCLAIYDDYDTAAWLYPNHNFGSTGSDRLLQPSALNRPMQQLRINGCLTVSSDIDGMPALAARLAPHTITDSGAPIRPTAVHVGIVTGFYDEGRTTQFFRSLGYRSRGVGALGLGRRIYIGPFTSQGSLDDALAIAREAGFISPYAAKHPKF